MFLRLFPAQITIPWACQHKGSWSFDDFNLIWQTCIEDPFLLVLPSQARPDRVPTLDLSTVRFQLTTEKNDKMSKGSWNWKINPSGSTLVGFTKGVTFHSFNHELIQEFINRLTYYYVPDKITSLGKFHSSSYFTAVSLISIICNKFVRQTGKK